MKRNIIKIDRDKCVGCGLCTRACHQGAIALVDGKATLMSESYCDGLGMCLPACPVDAIHLVETEAAEFDQSRKDFALKSGGGCPGSQAKALKPLGAMKPPANAPAGESELRQWPVQLHLVSPNAPYLQNANLLIAADCTPFAYADFHRQFMRGRVTLIGCPKLDDLGAYVEKLTEIFRHNDIMSVTVVRMSVPCCGGITRAVQEAIKASGQRVAYAEATITTEGEIA